HIRQQNPSGILRLTDISRYRNFGHRRMRLADEIEILRGVALPLLRDDFRVTFDQRILRAVTATGGEVQHHRLIHDDHVFGFCFDLSLWLLVLAHTESPYSPPRRGGPATRTRPSRSLRASTANISPNCSLFGSS